MRRHRRQRNRQKRMPVGLACQLERDPLSRSAALRGRHAARRWRRLVEAELVDVREGVADIAAHAFARIDWVGRDVGHAGTQARRRVARLLLRQRIEIRRAAAERGELAELGDRRLAEQ